jgi:hypothetical protein
MLFGSRIGFIVASKSRHIVLGKWGTDHVKLTPQRQRIALPQQYI